MRISNSALFRWSGLLVAAVLVASGCATTSASKKTDTGSDNSTTGSNDNGTGNNTSGTLTGKPGVGPDGKPLPPPPPPELTPAERVAAGKQKLAARDWTGAREDFAKALEKEPKNFDAILGKAQSWEGEGNREESLKGYEQVLAEQPGYEPYVLKLGEMYKRAEKYDQAIDLLSKASAANPDNVKIANNLGVTYRLAKKYAEAEKTLRKVLQRAPGNPDAYKNMAVLFLDQDKLALAEQFSIEARKIDEKDAGVWNNLGLIYFKKDAGKPSRALGAFKKAVELNPNEVTAWQNIGAISLRYRDFASAEKAFQKTVELDGASYGNHLSLAYAFDGAKKFDDAVREYDKAVELKGEEICEVHFLKGWIYQQQQKWKEVKDLYEKYQACADKDPSKTAARVEKILSGLKSAQYMIDLANKQGSQPMNAPPPPAPKAEEPKAEAPKAEEPKPAEAPKAEEPKVEPAKAEEPAKVEPAKAEETKPVEAAPAPEKKPESTEAPAPPAAKPAEGGEKPASSAEAAPATEAKAPSAEAQ
jgi:tetratricopeptide (TPR) repeat protein